MFWSSMLRLGRVSPETPFGADNSDPRAGADASAGWLWGAQDFHKTCFSFVAGLHTSINILR